VPPEPEPVPPPEPPKKEPEMPLPQPPKPTPPPRAPRTVTPSPRMAPQTATAKGTPSPRAAAGTTGGASAPPGTATGGAGTGKNAKATYIIRPVAAYPPESRTAGEQGVVILRLTVDRSGRPTAVSIAKSSGFPRLDRAATEAGWRCRVRNAAPGSHLDAPVRFNLSDR
ncbi:MAG: energy transducer TonB, partial [Chthoniobacteraceae bacterium]